MVKKHICVGKRKDFLVKKMSWEKNDGYKKAVVVAKKVVVVVNKLCCGKKVVVVVKRGSFNKKICCGKKCDCCDKSTSCAKQWFWLKIGQYDETWLFW